MSLVSLGRLWHKICYKNFCFNHLHKLWDAIANTSDLNDADIIGIAGKFSNEEITSFPIAFDGCHESIESIFGERDNGKADFNTIIFWNNCQFFYLHNLFQIHYLQAGYVGITFR